MNKNNSFRLCSLFFLASLLVSGCSRQQSRETTTVYPQPRFPAYVKAPTKVEEALPFARAAVRQEAGRTPLGLVEPGEHVVIFVAQRGWLEPNFIVLKAIGAAFQERKIKPLFIMSSPNQAVGSESQFIQTRPESTGSQNRPVNRVVLGAGYTSEKGYMEARNWIMSWSNPTEPREWLRQRSPATSEKMFPSTPFERRTAPISDAVIHEVETSNMFKIWGGGPREFLDQYREKVDAIFMGAGGREGAQNRLGPYSGKFYGNFVYDSYQETMSKIPMFPGDLWRLIEERTIEPIPWVETANAADPEGTDLTFEVTEEVAKLWAQGAYLPAHLFLYPHGATTLQPNRVLYPRLSRWLKPAMAKARGVLAATRNHTGTYPRMEVIIEDSKVKEVRGGGEYGDTLRAFLDHPNLTQVKNPYYDVPGYWFLFEGAVGTNPKAFIKFEELLEGRQSSEREAAGVIHWALGAEAYSDAPDQEGTNQKFQQQYNVPRGHGFHMHNLLSTYRVRIRGSNRWVTLIEKGRLAALDNPEVRALANRYGNPDEVLRQDWVPNFPGINAPGNYQKDYAANPWAHISKIMKEVEAGTYAYLVK
ncbi:MAG: hypothetical protein HY645_03260 [Acidobacteria bacterium]|nr:hypothetical protein [Acidobacteriota bacterium]